ncbi:MAG: SPOR domain-containing protein [Deltaproteobacteria bacterium]|nr:SPOR domain-containing protein [Deltaproteobacteria bacterium]
MTKNDTANKEKPSLWTNRRHIVMWLLIVLFVAAWMFALGIFVGRKSVPVAFEIDKLGKELAGLKQADIEKQRRRAEIDSDAANGKINFDYYDKLKDSKNINKRKPAPAKPKAKPLPEKTIKRTKKKAVKTQTAKTLKIPKKEKVIKPERKKRGEKTLTIQTASLKDSKDADRMVAELKKKGYEAYKAMAVVPDKGIWFRVKVGYYENSAEAADTLKRLKKDGLDAFLVNR